MQLIISGVDNKVITKAIQQDKRELLSVHPNEIAVNVGANNLSKYIVDGKAIKGAPWAAKGCINFNNLIKDLKLTKKYDRIGGVGEKVRVVYVKQPNRNNIETVGFIRWPQEFDKAGFSIDYSIMIEKFFIKKIERLLSPINKERLVYGDIDSFFG